MKQHLPNFITSINAFAGCVGIVFAFQMEWELVFWCVCIALVADFLDGFVARALHVSSAIGKELDSLADAITFGVLPGMVMFHTMNTLACKGQCTGLLAPDIYPYAAFLIPVFSVLRLAKFNLDTEQTYFFKGLATPANTAFFISLPLVAIPQGWHPKVVLALVFVFCFLLVSDLKLIAFKFKDYSLGHNWEKLVLMIGSMALLVSFGFEAFLFIVPFYLALSLIKYNPFKNHN